MNQTSSSLLFSDASLPGTAQQRIESALESLHQGRGVVVVDDDSRENEGDMIFAAETLTAAQMALMIREGSGIVCLCLTDAKADALALAPMVPVNNSKNRTAFTISIEAKNGVTTGVSATDRVTTVKTAIADNAKPEDLAHPGHVFPLRAVPGGVLQRRGHTEATIDLVRLAGLAPYGVLCEVTNADGTMARLPELLRFSEAHQLPLLSVEDIALYINSQEQAYSEFVENEAV